MNKNDGTAAMMNELGKKAWLGLHTAWQFLCHLARRFYRDGCTDSAAALTYITLFALVPLLTLMFSAFSLIPSFQGLEEQVQKLIFEHLIPESGADVQRYINDFTAQARKLSAVGAVILIVSAFMMLVNIERTFNKIWGTAGGRRGLSRILLYWAILSLGPILVGVGLSMNAYLLSYQWLVDELDKLGGIAQLFQVLPLLFGWIAASLLFFAVPNCQVKMRYAIIGGLVTTILFELLKSGFGLVVARSNFHNVYGAFAIVPLFLFWIYLVWTLLLIGAELVRALETFKTSVRGYTYPSLVAALVILSEGWRRQQLGRAISDREMLSVGVDQVHWQQLRDLFLQRRLLIETSSGRYVLARDIHHLQLGVLVEMFGEHFATQPSANAEQALARYGWYPQLQSLLTAFNEQSQPLLNMTVGELFDRDEKSFDTDEKS